jgi:hypothetical protein
MLLMELRERAERVRVSVERDMQGVSRLDASCAAGVILAIPGVAWLMVANWDGLMAYIASL